MAYAFTSDEEINAFEHEERTVDLTGYVHAIESLKPLRTPQGHVLKFVLNNDSNTRMRVLIWGTSLAKLWEPRVQMFSVLQIVGGTVKLGNPRYREPDVQEMEFHCQPTTDITILGVYPNRRRLNNDVIAPDNNIQNVAQGVPAIVENVAPVIAPAVIQNVAPVIPAIVENVAPVIALAVIQNVEQGVPAIRENVAPVIAPAVIRNVAPAAVQNVAPVVPVVEAAGVRNVALAAVQNVAPVVPVVEAAVVQNVSQNVVQAVVQNIAPAVNGDIHAKE
ncbi:hypothetical protein HCN44_010029 [Aphidius gifuensis]|uniref:Uncharacterized protein n=1 Tax=Aphidius gifuensis TaxID=684658 RepID=A0A834Y317_APHGI|nr:hypothetical protein HCN44_010029 [Aphidius gifuensis]